MKILNERPPEMSFEDYKEHLKKQKIYIKIKTHTPVNSGTRKSMTSFKGKK